MSTELIRELHNKELQKNRKEDSAMDEKNASSVNIPDDSEIIRRFFERDESALSAVSKKYGSYCSAVARNILGNEQSAEECVNDTLMRLWETIPPDRPGYLPAFIAKIARNIALNTVRAANALKRGGGEIDAVLDEIGELVSSADYVEEAAERHELMAAVNDFLGTLPENKQMVFVLRYWHCESISEIAACVGMTQSNVSNVLKRERKKLLDYLNKRGF